MDLLHGCAGVLHGDEGFLVDVCGFDGVDLLLEHGDLPVGLLEGVLVLLLAFEGVAGDCLHKEDTFISMVFPSFHSFHALDCDVEKYFLQCAIPGAILSIKGGPAHRSCSW